MNALRLTSNISTTEDNLYLYKANIRAVARGIYYVMYIFI